MTEARSAPTGLHRLGPIDPETDELNAIIETPKGYRNKYTYDEECGLFRLGGMLPVGAVFPFDFGFLPATLGGDGDPIDVLVLMEEPAVLGCVVPARAVGVVEADQTERDGTTTRNDRLIAVATADPLYAGVHSLGDLNEALIDQIEHFFISYNAIKGKRFAPLARNGPARARSLIDEAHARYTRAQSTAAAAD